MAQSRVEMKKGWRIELEKERNRAETAEENEKIKIKGSG